MEDSVLKGTLNYWNKGAISHRWESRFCVLYTTTNKQIGRLDWLKGNEDAYERYPKNRRTVYLEEITALLQSKHDDSRLFVFEIHTRSSKAIQTFATNSEEERRKWMRALEEAKYNSSLAGASTANDATERVNIEFQNENNHLLLDSGSIFEVAVNDTDLSRRLKLHGKYLLQLTHSSVQLMQLDDVNALGPLFTWPYRYIRRWGINKNYFTFEAGSKCASGEGLLSFATNSANAIFKLVQDCTKNGKTQNGALDSNFNCNYDNRQVEDGLQFAGSDSQFGNMAEMAAELHCQTSGKSKHSKTIRKNRCDEQVDNTPASSSLYSDSALVDRDCTTYSEPYFFVKEKAARIASSPFAAANVTAAENAPKVPPTRSRMAEIAMELQAQGPVRVGESSEYATLSLVKGANKATVISAERVDGDYGIIVSKNDTKNRKSSKS